MKSSILTPLLALGLSVSASAQVLMLDFGGTATDRSTNSPYHTVNGTYSDGSWNNIGLVDPGSVVFGNGDTATGVSVTMGLNSGTTGTTINLATQPTNLLTGTAYTAGSNIYTSNSIGRDGVFGGSSGTTTPWVGVQITGLAAGTYDVYVAARNTNTGTAQSNYDQIVFAGKSVTGNFDFGGYGSGTLSYDGSSPTNASSSWVQEGNSGENYVKLSVSITAGEAINIAVQGDGASGGANRGFLNAIQIVNTSTIPEPSAFAALGGLAALGLAAAGRRRHRR